MGDADARVQSRGITLAIRRLLEPAAWTGLAAAIAVATAVGSLEAPFGLFLLVVTVSAVAGRLALRPDAPVQRDDARALAFAATGDGCWDYDVRSSSIVYDERCATMLGYPAGGIDSHLGAWGKLVHADDLEGARASLDDFVSGRADSYEIQVRLRGSDGHWLRILDRARIVERDADGRPVRLVGVHRLLPAAAKPAVVEPTRRVSLGEAMRSDPKNTAPTPSSVFVAIENAVASRDDRALRIAFRPSDPLGDAWVAAVTLESVIAFILDAVAECTANDVVLPARSKAPRDLRMVGFAFGLPAGVQLDSASPYLEAARSLLRACGGHLRLRSGSVDVELPTALGRTH